MCISSSTTQGKNAPAALFLGAVSLIVATFLGCFWAIPEAPTSMEKFKNIKNAKILKNKQANKNHSQQHKQSMQVRKLCLLRQLGGLAPGLHHAAAAHGQPRRLAGLEDGARRREAGPYRPQRCMDAHRVAKLEALSPTADRACEAPRPEDLSLSLARSLSLSLSLSLFLSLSPFISLSRSPPLSLSLSLSLGRRERAGERGRERERGRRSAQRLSLIHI